MVFPTVMSRNEVDGAALTRIAKMCRVSVDQIEDVYSCTALQRGMIDESRDEVLHVVLSFGPMADISRFCEAVRQVVSLNSILRTRIVDCSGLGLVQVVTSQEHATERRSSENGEVVDIDQYLAEDGVRRLGLGAPLFRSTVLGDRFVASIHHAITDYWAITTFLKGDVLDVYYGRQPLPVRPAFKEFVAHCMHVNEATAKDFWISRFRGIPAVFPPVHPGFSPCATQKITRQIDLKEPLARGSVSHVHLPSFILAAWSLTASTYSNSAAIAFGLVFSGRWSGLEGVETTFGPTIAEVPVQVNLQHTMAVERLIKDRATSLRQLQTHPALQYDLARIGAVNEAVRTAMGFQTLINIRPAVEVTGPSTDIGVDRIVWPNNFFSLSLVSNILPDGIFVELRFDPAVLCERQVYRLLNQYQHTLQLLTEVPVQTKLNSLQLLNPHDRSEIIEWNKAVPSTVERCVHELFSAQAQMQPDAMAVEAHDGSASYARLDQMSERLAHELRRKGISTGQPVVFIFEKSLWAIVAVLGIMKAGGVCVPVDKDAQRSRKAAIITGTKAKAILTSSIEHANLACLAPDILAVSAESIADLPEATYPLDDCSSRPEHLAYIIFTGDSTSTATSKGVMLEHRSLVSSLMSLAHRLGWQQPGSRILQFFAHASSISATEIFGALMFGGCLHIPPGGDGGSDRAPSDIAGFIESSKANWALIPSRTLCNMSPDDVPGLQSVLSIGERIHADASRTWSRAVRLFHGWGACETSTVTTVAELTPSSHYPESIGQPVGCAVWIVNPRNANEIVPIGGVGELVIQGPGVARGYLNDKASTMALFIPPLPWTSSSPSSCERGHTATDKTRFHRTGDLAKYNPDGSISFVGSISNQVKLGMAGQKFQLEEPEHVLLSCIQVRDIAVAAKISAGRTQLVALVCLADPQLPRGMVMRELPDAYAGVVRQRLDEVRGYARSRLPSDRMPSIWVSVGGLPRTASDRLDRAAIREWVNNPISYRL